MLRCTRKSALIFNAKSIVIKDRLRWFGHVEHKDEDSWMKCCMMRKVDGTRLRGRTMRTWWKCVGEDVKGFGACS